MSNRFMASVAALALIAGTSLAYAQGGGMKNESGGSTMQHSTTGNAAGSESSEQSKSKGGMKAGQSEQKSPGAMKNQNAQEKTKGGMKEGQSEQKSPGAMKKQNAQENTKSGNANQRAEERNKAGQTTGQSNTKMQGQQKGGTNAAETSTTTQRSQTTTGQAGAGAKLTSDQRTKITTVFRSEHVQPENNVNFSISVGTRVPREGVHFRPLPAQVVTIYPQWRGYEFIRVRDQILVIDPNTYEIVAILEA
ncbi:MAG TPA: DUF1236 domain-containing protein [Bradyrhizobium sp.]|uniref:DUF1236 domain-containing protein n=1 Tax=Bradyrhizobium sp. TaxID=376 RepID=UPI002C3BB5D1|nr:DUF1236 domain-containing protein [Bradyrhizobium sp.]HLZ03359.1 DUF1236 domain-containing protein [Bradyrhizobium sp.]